jgi:hypothetical protein
MQTVLKGTSWITPKEMNLLLRDYAMNQGYEQINYTKLPEDLYYIRFELANSQIMETNIDIIEKTIHNACKKVSTDGKYVKLNQMR